MAVEEVVAVEIGEISGRATYWGKGGEEMQPEQSGDDYWYGELAGEGSTRFRLPPKSTSKEGPKIQWTEGKRMVWLISRLPLLLLMCKGCGGSVEKKVDGGIQEIMGLNLLLILHIGWRWFFLGSMWQISGSIKCKGKGICDPSFLLLLLKKLSC